MKIKDDNFELKTIQVTPPRKRSDFYLSRLKFYQEANNLPGNETDSLLFSANRGRIPMFNRLRDIGFTGLFVALLLALILSSCGGSSNAGGSSDAGDSTAGGGSDAGDSPGTTDNPQNDFEIATISANAPWIGVKNQRFTIIPPSAIEFDPAKSYSVTLNSKDCMIDATSDVTAEKIIVRCPDAVESTEKVGMALKEGENTFPAVDLIPEEPITMIKIDSKGYPLADQSKTYSTSGSEKEGTKWTCVLQTFAESENLTNIGYGDGPTNFNKTNPGDWILWQANPSMISFNQATSFAANFNSAQFCGKNNWRLPILSELNALYFVNENLTYVQRDWVGALNAFWSSSILTTDSAKAYVYAFYIQTNTKDYFAWNIDSIGYVAAWFVTDGQ